MLKQLNDEEYVVREKATLELSKYPYEYSERFLLMARTEHNPEVRHRLRTIAETIFYSTVTLEDDAYLRCMGDIGVYYTAYCYWDGGLDFKSPTLDFAGYLPGIARFFGNTVGGFFVRAIDPTGPASQKLKQNDLIIEIDGVKISKMPGGPRGGIGTWGVAGKDIKFRVRRYFKPNSLDQQNYVSESNIEYLEFDVVIRVGWKTETYGTKANPTAYAYFMDLATDRHRALWNGFLLEFECKNPTEEVPNNVRPARLNGVYPR